MSDFTTTKMSSKGQVVIPEDIRNRMHLSAGSQFVVMGEDDVVIMKIIKKPDMKDFDDIIKKARKVAKASGMTKEDVRYERKNEGYYKNCCLLRKI